MADSIPGNPADHDRALLTCRHPALVMAAAMGVSICQFLDMTIANVALPHMQTSLNAGMDSISWVLTSYIIAGAIFLPLTGWLSDRFGSRNLFIAATALFVVTSMLCGTATSLSQMVVFRTLQGIGSAFMGPLSQTILYDINRPSKQARAMGIWGAVVMVAPISGPFIGGFLTETLNWRWVFYVNLPVGIPSLLLLIWQLPSRPLVGRPLDLRGAAMLGIGLGSLQLALDRGQQKDWLQSWEITIELMVALACFWMFFIHSMAAKQPLFDRRLMHNSNFIVAMGFMLLLGIVNVALASVLPSMYQQIYGFSVMDTGLLMAPRGFGVLVTMMVANRLVGRIDSRWLISIGYLICAIALWTMTRWSLEMDRTPIVLSSFIQGLGLGLVFMPMNVIAFATLEPQYRPDGATLLALFRNLGSSLGISAIVTMLARNIQVSHADISAHILSSNAPLPDLGGLAARFGVQGGAMLEMLDLQVNRQAAMIAYLDNFYMLFWVVLAFVPFTWLLRKPSQPAGVPAVANEL